MSYRTIIFLQAVLPIRASWIFFTDSKQVDARMQDDLTNLPLLAKQNEITVIVPADDVLLTQAELPKLNRQRLMQALPFALEEQLIDDVSELHFAIADYQDGKIPVAIVARKKMNEWLAELKELGIQPSRLLSAVFALPFIEKNWTACITAEMSAIRTEKYSGFASDPSNLALMIDLTLKNAVEKPTCIHIYNTLGASIALNTDSILQNDIHLSEQDWLEKTLSWIDINPSINLLQGHYQAKRKASETKKIWITAGYVTLAWLGLLFVGHLISFFILHHEASKLDQAINTIYKQNFPEASSVVAPRERMEDQLKKLSDEANKNYFLVLLAKVGDLMSKTPEVQLKNLDFRDNQLNLELLAGKFDDLDKLTKKLMEQGLTVKQQNASVVGTEVKANVLIQRGTS